MSPDDDVVGRASSRVGSVLRGKYRIDRVLGVGGMAVVYAATHRNQKQFAVKLLHPELSMRRDIRTRFLREGYAANSVKHPGVVAVLDDDVDEDGSAFLVMELLDGATVEELRSRLGSRLPVREALNLTHQLLDVLSAAHAKAIVHRDIKPANLFVCADGQLKVLDFGIARVRDVTAGLQATSSGAGALGTPAFMSPEQALARGSEVDARTDVWAVGATLFTILSGQFVHGGDFGQAVLIRAATTPARSLASVAPDCLPAIVDVVARALAFDKASRWESAVAMGDSVARIHRDLFGEPPAPERLKSLLERQPSLLETTPPEPSRGAVSGSSPVGAIAATARSPSGSRGREDASASTVGTTTRAVSTRMSPGQAREAPTRRGVARRKVVAVAAFVLLTGSPVVLALRRGSDTRLRIQGSASAPAAATESAQIPSAKTLPPASPSVLAAAPDESPVSQTRQSRDRAVPTGAPSASASAAPLRRARPRTLPAAVTPVPSAAESVAASSHAAPFRPPGSDDDIK